MCSKPVAKCKILTQASNCHGIATEGSYRESDKRFSGRTCICQLIRKTEYMSSLPLKELLFLRALGREYNMPLTIKSSVSEAVVFWVVRV